MTLKCRRHSCSEGSNSNQMSKKEKLSDTNSMKLAENRYEVLHLERKEQTHSSVILC